MMKFIFKNTTINNYSVFAYDAYKRVHGWLKLIFFELKQSPLGAWWEDFTVFSYPYD